MPGTAARPVRPPARPPARSIRRRSPCRWRAVLADRTGRAADVRAARTTLNVSAAAAGIRVRGQDGRQLDAFVMLQGARRYLS